MEFKGVVSQLLSVKRILRRSFLLLPLLALTSAVSLLGVYPLEGLAASFDARADYTAWLRRHPYWPDEHPGCVGGMIYEMPIGKSPSRGPANAKVTLVEFVDFNDSYSRQLALACESFLKRHPGQFRLVFKNFPNSHNRHSLEQHRVAMAALLQGKFWPMYERLFVHVDDGQRNEDTYLRWAKQLHLDLDKFQRDRKSAAVDALIASDINDSRECFMPPGAPQFFLNGRRVTTSKSMQELQNGVDFELWQ